MFGEAVPADHECRRFPPTQVPIGDYSGPEFPKVNEDDWCGEWKQAKG